MIVCQTNHCGDTTGSLCGGRPTNDDNRRTDEILGSGGPGGLLIGATFGPPHSIALTAELGIKIYNLILGWPKSASRGILSKTL